MLSADCSHLHPPAHRIPKAPCQASEHVVLLPQAVPILRPRTSTLRCLLMGPVGDGR